MALHLARASREPVVNRAYESKEDYEHVQQWEEGTGLEGQAQAPLKRGIVEQGSAFITDMSATSAVRHGVLTQVRRLV